MSVGTQPTMGGINATLTTLAIQMRETFSDVLYQQAYLNMLGLTGLEALGFAPADAQSVLDHVNHMATVAQVYKGTQGQAAAGQTAANFNFETALTDLWGGA